MIFDPGGVMRPGRNLNRRVALGAVLALVVGAVGCGAPLARATGTVTLSGKALTEAEVTFAREDDPETTVHGRTGRDGRFYLNYPLGNGTPPGKYRIVVTRYTLPNGKPLPGGEEGEALRSDESRVQKWTVRFERDLVAGNNAIDLEWNQGQPHREP